MGQAVTMADGSILLLGGQIDPNCRKKQRGCTGWAANQTVERVTPGKYEVVFSIKHGAAGGRWRGRLAGRWSMLLLCRLPSSLGIVYNRHKE